MSHLCTLPSFPCLYPLGLNQSSPRMAESPFTSAHPVYILQKTVFQPVFVFCFLFLRSLAKSSFRPQPFVRWYPIYPALSTDQKMPPTSRCVPCLPSLEALRSPSHPFVQGREYHLNGRPPKICSPLLLA